MDSIQIQSPVLRGEGYQLEFKECRAAVNKSVFETGCSFLNRSGGEILLGVSDNGTIIGVDLITENSNRPHVVGPIKPLQFSPCPKNPLIARVFREIGRADELGSGVRNLFKYCVKYCHHDPLLTEADVFRFELSLDEVKTVEKTVGKILALIHGNPRISTSKLVVETGLSRRGVEWNLEQLKSKGSLRRIGPDKGGYWEVIEK